MDVSNLSTYYRMWLAFKKKELQRRIATEQAGGQQVCLQLALSRTTSCGGVCCVEGGARGRSRLSVAPCGGPLCVAARGSWCSSAAPAVCSLNPSPEAFSLSSLSLSLSLALTLALSLSPSLAPF